jgi:hypothetical protein
MMQLPQALSDFFKKLNAAEINLSKAGLGKLFAKKNADPFDDANERAAPQKTPLALPKALSIDLRATEIGRYFSGNVFEKAVLTIDKSTLLIIGIAWLVAMVVAGLAFATVKEASQLRLKTEVARALEPVLPKIVRLPLSKEQYEPLLLRLKKQFPTITFEITPKPTLKIHTSNADEFISWLNAVSYTDSMVSTVRWTLASFCVGVECPSEGLMQAELTAEAINITQPESPPP